MRTDHLSLDQGPPLAVPMSFFALVPLSMLLAGALMLAQGDGLTAGTWGSTTLALTHLLTLGVLGAAMCGALTQLVPVVAGARLRWVFPLRPAALLLALGLLSMAGGLLSGETLLLRGAQGLLGGAILVVGFVVGEALLRAPTANATTRGMKVAVLSLLSLLTVGLLLLEGQASGRYPGPRLPWLQLHLLLALGGWLGSLLVAVSWQVVPMFWMTPAPRPGLPVVVLGLQVAGLLLGLLGFGLGSAGLLGPGWAAGWLLPLLALPLLVGTWVIHPLVMLRGLHERKRRRPDSGQQAWTLGLSLGPVALAVALLAVATDLLRLPLLAGWLLLWGWAGSLILGTMTRVAPFLAWLHGGGMRPDADPATLRSRLPEALVRRWLRVHTATVLVGAVAAGLGLDPLVRLTGLLMMAEAVLVLGGARVLWRQVHPAGQAAI
jgi:hypothetical protein